MATNDIRLMEPNRFGMAGSRRFQVAADSGAPTINEGEPVAKALGQQYVASLATAKPVVGTDYLAGLSMEVSSETTSANGVVAVMPFIPGEIYLCDATTPSAVATQALYNALVGFRVVFTKTGDVYTVNDTDGATNGLVIEDLDVTRFPNQIAFSVRAGAMYTA